MRFIFLQIYIAIKSTIGKIVPAKNPIFILSLNLFEIKPTSPGPAVQPKSPPSASSAKSAVPPLLIDAEALLKEPGHIIPTESPHTAQPIKLTALFGTRLIIRYDAAHKTALILKNL